MSWKQFDNSMSADKRTTLIQRKEKSKARDRERAMARKFKYVMNDTADLERLESFMFTPSQEVQNG